MFAWLPPVLAGGLILAFAGFLGLVLSHPIYLGNDSAQSYAHVWFIEHSLFSGDGIPLRIPLLENGRALTLPYGAIPWVPTALLRPLLGDWAVTASMVVGVVLLLVSIVRWLPRLASPLMLGAVLLNWQLWNGILQFQLPTIWALAFACFSAASFDRSQPRRGAAFAAAALIAHPLMGGAGLAFTLLVAVEATRQLPLRRLPWLAAATVCASPAIWMFLATPSVGEASAWSPLLVAHLMAQRLSLLWWPWLCARFQQFVVPAYAPLLLLGALLMARNVWASNPTNLRWRSLPRFPDYVAAGKVDPDARYRVLTMSNQEDGMVQLIQSGAVLTQSFFDESVARHSFRSTEAYRCFLAKRGATHVLVSTAWIRRGTTNELQMLDTLVVEGQATLAFQGAAGTREYRVGLHPPENCR